MNRTWPTLLHAALETAAADAPDRIAVVADGRRYSYAQVEQGAARLAACLRRRGVQRGDRVALFLENRFEAVVSVYAILKIGAVFMPINPLTKRDKLAYMLNDARAAAVITEVGLQSECLPAIRENRWLHTVLFVGDRQALEAATASERRTEQFPGSDAADDAVDSCVERATIDQDLASIIYTSGSTGDPKGVMLTHLNMVSAAAAISTYLGLKADDRIICVLPLAFDYGLYQMLMAFRVGATLVLERSFMFPVKVLEVMVQERVTAFPGVPTLFSMLMNLKTLDRYDLSALRAITNTAAALSEEHIRRLRALFPQATLFSMYGLTECKRVTYLPPEQLDMRPTSVGRGMPNEEVWLVDENGARLPNGGVGELVIRGSNVMRGYWEKPQETAERLRPGPTPGEVVLYSGDLFRTDDEGYLYFVARKDDIIKSRGEKVSPREVENVLYGLAGVIDAAVIGVPDPLLGQAVKAFLVVDDSTSFTEREVIKYCLARLESFMVPKFVKFVAELPKTDTGKIKKTGLS